MQHTGCPGNAAVKGKRTMTDKKLRKLRRHELLEILVEQGKQQEQIRQELELSRQQLEQRQLNIEESGSIADAAFRLNDVMGAAQRAADLYTENVKRVMDQQQQESERALSEAQTHAAQMVADAEKRVRAALDAANDQAARIIANARAEADRITAESQTDAQRILADAQIQRDTLLAEARKEAGLPDEAAAETKKRRGLFGRRG